MTVVDVIILFVIFLSALFSLMRGFVKEAISLTTWLAAIWISATFAPRLAALLPVGIESEAVRLALGFRFALLFFAWHVNCRGLCSGRQHDATPRTGLVAVIGIAGTL
jgi:membrane protein required for colicin V production